MGRGGGATWGRELSRARGRLSRPPHLPRSHTLTPFPPGHAQLVCKSHGKALASGQSSPSPSPAHSLHPRSPLHGIYCAPRRLDRRLPGLGTASLPPHPAPGHDREKQTPGGPGLHRSLGLSAWPAAALPWFPHVVVVPWHVPSLGARDRGSNSRCMIGIKYMAVSDFCPLCALDACPC